MGIFLEGPSVDIRRSLKSRSPNFNGTLQRLNIQTKIKNIINYTTKNAAH